MYLYTNRQSLIASYMIAVERRPTYVSGADRADISYNLSPNTGCRKCGRNIQGGSLRFRGYSKPAGARYLKLG
jgi:hypothetical protein